MDSRAIILDKIKKAISDVDKTKTVAPELPTIWEHQGLSKDELIGIFSENLKSVAGQAFPCKDQADAVKQISEQLQNLTKSSTATQPYMLGAYGSELVKSVVPGISETISNWKVEWAPQDPNADPKYYEHLTASLVSPVVLLADTGSCPIEAKSAFDRILCYLSPACFVVAKASQLREHLPDAWPEIEAKMQNNTNGEVAIVTGPSRTADIEKKLVLGVHGPQKLFVFIIQD